MTHAHHAYLRLREAWTAEPERLAAEAAVRGAASGVPGVTRVAVGTPSDAHAAAAWDLAVLLEFESAESLLAASQDRAWTRMNDTFARYAVVYKGWSFTLE